uniref:Calmodulin-binding domain-containing protein n=1 Tax=Kalanchoe fedtschenkoi TaxID=63787 RepID=A0A7N0T8U3_KALFE
MKSEATDVRRISLPIFPSDLGKDVPNYLRASIGSCHDHCKYGKETTAVEQKQPRKKKTEVTPLDSRNVVLNKGVSVAKTAKVNRSGKPKSALPALVERHKPDILPEAKTGQASVKQSASSEKETRPPEQFPKKCLRSKLVNEKSLARKSTSTSGSSKSDKLKGKPAIVPNPLGSWDGMINSMDLDVVGKDIGNKIDAKNVKKCNKAGTRNMTAKSVKAPSAHAPVKPNAKAKPPSFPTSLKLGTKAKVTSSSTPLLLKPTALSKQHSSPAPSKSTSVRENSSSLSSTKKLKAATVKTSPPSIPPPSVKSKKINNNRDRILREGGASKVRASENKTARCGSVAVNYATNMKNKELQLEKLEEAEAAEKKVCYGKNEEDLSHPAESANQEIMVSYDNAVPEKTLYVIKLGTGNRSPPNDEDEIPDMQPLASLTPPLLPGVTESSMTSQHNGSQYELRNAGTALLSAEEEAPDIQPLPSLSPPTSPKSQLSIMASITSSHYDVSRDGSIHTESEEDYSSDDNDDLVEEEENLMGAGSAKHKKSVTTFSQNNDNGPVKLKFRRGRVVHITQENNGPRRLMFRRAKVRKDNAAENFVPKSSIKKVVEATQDNILDSSSSGKVVLRHQDVQDKRDAQGLFNNVIEETASKLVETRKSKVKALVGAFETVISLQDGKPTTQ